MSALKVLFLGRLAALAGGRERIWAGQTPSDVAALIEAIRREAPDLAAALDHPSVRVAVNQAIAPRAGTALSPGDEVAFLPPVSGG